MTGRAGVLAGDVLAAARAILGWCLVSDAGGARTALVITEVEAYGGADDPASHAFGGETARNRVMFGPPGRLYVYRSYGVHWCANVVTGPPGAASAVLIRAGRIAAGRRVIEGRRGRSDHLADGPGKLCAALAITGEHDGVDLLAPASEVRLEPAPPEPATVIATGPRVGISKAVDRPWRFRLVPGRT